MKRRRRQGRSIIVFGLGGRHRAFVRKVGKLHARDFSSDKALNRRHIAFFLGRHERVGVADFKRPARASDAVHVIFRLFRDIEIDDVAQFSRIKPRVPQ